MEASAPSPAERAARAAERARQLQQRRLDLAAGSRPTPESLQEARRHADEAEARAREAHRAATLRHGEVAHVHERAANALQRVVMEGGADPAGLQERADAHWQAAQEHYELRSRDTSVAEDQAGAPPSPPG
ncbi:hypothetical protein ACNUDN_11670 [Mycobacterium sp. smrl_JER01]|uniref:hypothetical protein n=1 Tax=Mycobacterium sp. smrl_JER01 TaxID=3402633 RepID=UPI003AD0FCBF